MRKKPGRRRRPGFRRGTAPSLAAMMAKPFQDMVSQARVLAGDDDPLQAELFASEIAGTTWGLPLIDQDLDFEALFGKGLVQHAHRRGGPEGVALLLALSAVQPSWAKQAGAAARQLMARGVPAPEWATSIGRPRFAGAWLGIEPFGDQDVLVAAFDYDGQPGHALQLLIDNNLDGIAKDIGVMGDVECLLREWSEVLPELRFLTLDGETAASRMAYALQTSDEYGPGGPMSEDFRGLRALAKARLRLLPPARPGPVREPLDEAVRQGLVSDFFVSPEGVEASRHHQAALIASRLVDYRSDYGDGDPLRWSPIVVELCLCDWYPRKVAADEAEIGQVAAVLRPWVRYTGRRRGLEAALIEETVKAVAEYAPEFVEAMCDPSRYGPAKAVLLEMQRDGVDVTDLAEVQRWTDAFNARNCPF